MEPDDVLMGRGGSRVKARRTVSLKLLDESDIAEEEPPSQPVARGATPKKAAPLKLTEPEGADGAFEVSQRSMAFCRRHFPEATVAQWNDWKWQLRSRLKDLKTLERVFRLSPQELEKRMEGRKLLPLTMHWSGC